MWKGCAHTLFSVLFKQHRLCKLGSAPWLSWQYRCYWRLRLPYWPLLSWGWLINRCFLLIAGLFPDAENQPANSDLDKTSLLTLTWTRPTCWLRPGQDQPADSDLDKTSLLTLSWALTLSIWLANIRRPQCLRCVTLLSQPTFFTLIPFHSPMCQLPP